METNATGNVLPGATGTIPASSQPSPKNKNYSALSVFLAMILVIVLILLGERIIFDLNRFINPAVDKEYTNAAYDASKNRNTGIMNYQYESPQLPLRSTPMLHESAGVVSDTKIYYQADQQGRYLMYKLIIHAAIILPLFALAFMLYYLKRQSKEFKPILISFLIAAFWLMFHLLGETTKFVMNSYRNVAIYFVLAALTGIFGFFAYYAQLRHSKNIGS